MTHESSRLLAAGAVLDDLDADERRTYEAHLAGCPRCGTLETELRHVLADLALAAPERIPPVDLVGSIRQAIHDGPIAAPASAGLPGRPGSPEAVAATPPVSVPQRPGWTHPVAEGDTTSRRPSRRSWPAIRLPRRTPRLALLGAATAAAIMVVGLGVQVASLESRLTAAATQLAVANARAEELRQAVAGQREAMAVAVDPRHVTTALHAKPLAPAARAYVLFVPGTDQAWLVAMGLPATPAGHAYQLWYADSAGVHGLGKYAYDGSGTFVVPFAVDLGQSGAAMVTLEPVAGVGRPGPQVVFGEL